MKRKPEWNNSREFLLSVIGYSVGIGNVWRFPYTCYDSGGGAFLIIYLIMWALCGIPLMYLELAVGQHTRKGPIGALCQLCPLFKGAGVGCVVWIAICRTLYMVLLVWPFYYLFNSFISVFPWSTCGNLWNTPDCKDSLRQPFNTSTNGHGDANITTWNVTMVINTTQESMVTYPASEYFRNHVLQLTSGIENLGHVRWDYALILVLSWSLIYLSIFKGPKLTGKIVYVTVLFPYVVLFIFIVRGFTLPGSYTGMLFFLKPNWSSLLKPKVWISAAVTNFFSLGIGGGANITLASYNHYSGKILRYTVLIGVVDLATSLMAGTAVFTNLGYLAEIKGLNIGDVVESGTELAFVVFPEIFTTMPLSQLFSVLFFLMILTLAIDTMFVGVETVVTAIIDQFPNSFRREILTAIVAMVFYLLALPTITQGGLYYFSVMDYYVNFVSGFSLAFVQIISFAWIYGGRRLSRDITKMTGSPPNSMLVFCWYFVSPSIIGALSIFSIVRYQPFTLGTYTYPTWSLVLTWSVSLIPVICIPIGMAHSLYKAEGASIYERFLKTLKPKDTKTGGIEDDNEFLESSYV